MNEEKQIEKIAEVIYKSDIEYNNIFPIAMGECLKKYGGVRTNAATALYNAGYREQIEWISVEDRLPEDCVKVFTYNGVTVKLDFYDASFNTWFSEMHEATIPVAYWMPLPEPPKMKGE